MFLEINGCIANDPTVHPTKSGDPFLEFLLDRPQHPRKRTWLNGQKVSVVTTRRFRVFAFGSVLGGICNSHPMYRGFHSIEESFQKGTILTLSGEQNEAPLDVRRWIDAVSKVDALAIFVQRASVTPPWPRDGTRLGLSERQQVAT